MTQEFDIEDSWIDILLSLLPDKSETIKSLCLSKLKRSRMKNFIKKNVN